MSLERSIETPPVESIFIVQMLLFETIKLSVLLENCPATLLKLIWPT
ncbi:hypothetical protein T07_2745 [Trichinella nelsoni]|uniref:Uncharacterized protein n=1 Tax=Trichinella nelsoni TaxID=6336 RepID=A0A0V0S708_9BILA|nr:hypothetical protein T07_2745 [Trichinella nelsoni]